MAANISSSARRNQVGVEVWNITLDIFAPDPGGGSGVGCVAMGGRQGGEELSISGEREPAISGCCCCCCRDIASQELGLIEKFRNRLQGGG